MCGIAGIVAQNSRNCEKEVRKMADALGHRGPDDEGIFLDEKNGVALGHRRLSILDLSAAGHQPMVWRGARDEEIVIVFNGEIYNFLEIKKDLLGKGYSFRTKTDTEAILALYNEYGGKSFAMLKGMFAFAMWDGENEQLVCARDRFGEKPLYYAWGVNGEFIFASEIKAILASGLVKPILDLESVSCYLGHLYVYPNKTIYKNIHTLPAGHQLAYKNGEVEIKRYWNLPPVNQKITLDEVIPVFRNLLNQAVERQLIADVPVGAFLSGGLDSSTIVAVASQFKPKIKTFSFAFRDSIDETPYAREIAKKYNTDHVELFDDGEDLGELFIKMQEIYDEPLGDSSNIPTYLISKLARQYTKVVLTGDGGDEILGGYGWYKPFLYLNSKDSVFWRNQFVYFIARAVRRINGNQFLLHKVLGARHEAVSDVVQVHLATQQNVFNNAELAALDLPQFLEKNYYQPSWKAENNLNDVFRVDLENYMPGDILVKTDRASMANGLELRAPFLDVDLASFCISLPYQLKVNKDSDKIILHKAAADLWTPSIRKRTKQGFGAPVGKWLQEKSLAGLRRDYLQNSKRKIFDVISFDASQLFAAKNNYQTWALLVLALWMEKHNFDL